jgi:dolichol-phosphate mannosyltransferase
MDADWSHHPRYLAALLTRLDEEGGADLVIGSRYAAGGGVRNWGLLRKIVSRGGSLFARKVLRLTPNDLTGGFKAWRRDTLAATPWSDVHSGGYVFSIEMTYLASRRGARVAEVPIIFVDRRVGSSKMSRRIVFEALLVVLTLRWEELRGRGATGSRRNREDEGGG